MGSENLTLEEKMNIHLLHEAFPIIISLYIPMDLISCLYTWNVPMWMYVCAVCVCVCVCVCV
jgi:hypothetical protein